MTIKNVGALSRAVRITNAKSGAIFVSLLALAFTSLPASAFASVTVNAPTLNGSATASVAPSATITVVASVTTTNNEDWESTRYRIGSSGSFICVNTSNHSSSGTNTESFNVTAPSTPGVYSIEIDAFGYNTGSNDNCSTSFSGQIGAKVVSNAVTVTSPKQNQTITVTQAAPSSAMNTTSFSVAATASSALPVAITTTGGCSISGSTVTMTSATTACVVHFNQAGNASYNAAPEITETVSALAFNPNAFNTGLVTFSFDDGYLSTYTQVHVNHILGPIYKGTMYINSDEMFGATECDGECYQAYMPTADVIALHDDGNEIGAHTRSHIDSTTLTPEDLLSQIDGSRLDLLTLGIDANVTTLAYPFGTSNADVVAKLKSAGFIAARTVDSDALNDKATDHYALHALQINNDVTLADVESAIDEAIAHKEWLTFVIHEVQNDCSADQYCTTPTELAGIVSYLQAHESGLDVVTMSQGMDLMGGIPLSDGVAPVITQADVSAAATSPDGAAVSFSPVVTDNDVDLPAVLNAFCTNPAVQVELNPGSGVFYPKAVFSGDTFPIGVTTVNCSAADTGGNLGTKTFTITVTDGAPVIAAHADVTAEETDSNGAIVNYDLPAVTDDVTTGLTASCLPASGSTFALGTTAVNCTAGPDGNGHNATPTTFNVIVHDTTAPQVTLNGDAAVSIAYGGTYDDAGATATDAVTTGLTVTATGLPVDTTVLGDHVITYSATDAAGNTGTATRTVTVAAASADIALNAPLTRTYDSIAQTVTATSDYPYSVTYDGNATAPTNAGSYDVVATITDANHAGSAEGTLVISPVTLSVQADNIAKAFGTADPALTYTVTDGAFVGTDAFLTSTLTREPGEAIGTYDVDGTFDAGTNYDVTFTKGTFTISADPSNATPVAGDQSVSVDENSSVAITLVGTDSDADMHGNPVLVWDVDEPAHGHLSGTAPALTYAPDADFYGTDSFTFTVADGNSESAAGTVNITVNLLPNVCAEGYTFDGSLCQPVPPTVSGCPDGTAFNSGSGMCEQTTAEIPATPTNTCPDGSTLNEAGDQCIPNAVDPVAPTCDAGTYNPDTNQCEDVSADPVAVSPATCPSDMTLDADTDMCVSDSTPFTPTTTYTCGEGYTVDGDQCVPNPVAPSAPQCPANTTDNGDGTCALPINVPPTCLADYHEEGSICVADAHHTITATASGNGAVSPSGAVDVTEGTDQSFSFTPASGFHIADVLVDGASVGTVDHYGFSDVAADHTVTVSFAADQASSGGGSSHRSRSGGGGGGGSASVQGQVLGASTGASCYVFSADLTLGSTGADVTALQNFLIGKGFIIPAGATGYFGAQTKAALAAYQAATGIAPAVGYFGPLTRAQVNAACATSVSSSGDNAALLAQLEAEVAELQAKLNALNGA